VIVPLIIIFAAAVLIYASFSYQGGSSMSTTAGTGVQLLAEAIAVAEGFYIPGTIPNRANNPGDLTKGDFGDTGVYITAKGGVQIIQYASVQDGWNALYQKLQNIANGGSSVYSPDMTLGQFINTFSGGGSTGYVNSILSTTGATQDTPLGSVLS
jgi:hypothetical protein